MKDLSDTPVTKPCKNDLGRKLVKRLWHKALCVFKRADIKAGSLYEKCQNSFFGKLILKLTSEIILACLISAAVYFATDIHHNMTAMSTDIKNLNKVYISLSEEYTTSMFGTPYISFVDENNYKNNFYMLQKSVLRTVFDNDCIIAFFITAADSKSHLPVSAVSGEEQVLGKVTYTDIDFPTPQTEAYFNSDGRYAYYSETQGTGRYAMYNYYVFGYLPYGFTDDSSYNLIRNWDTEDGPDLSAHKKNREQARPNTFGVIADTYQDSVSIFPGSNEWSSMHYLLDKNSK